MFKKLLIISICLAIISLTMPEPAEAINLYSLAKIAKVVTDIRDIIKAVQTVSKVVGLIPHKFPFGGHITSSERACSFKAWIWASTPLSFGIPVPCPNCLYIPLGGRAIEVGPPVPTNGKVITFPWISDIYKNHAENRVGPWALGLGFTPFPLKSINDSLGKIVITIPITGAPTCAVNFGTGICLDHFHFACSSSGTDSTGNDIYKVILKLGTSP